MAVKPVLGISDGAAYLGILQRLTAAVAHIANDLRQRLEPVADLRNWLIPLLDHGKQLQCGDKAITGGRKIRQDDVARLLAANVVTMLAHIFEYIAVANRRADEGQVELLQIPLEAQVGHHRADDARLAEQTILGPTFCDKR